MKAASQRKRPVRKRTETVENSEPKMWSEIRPQLWKSRFSAVGRGGFGRDYAKKARQYWHFCSALLPLKQVRKIC